MRSPVRTKLWTDEGAYRCVSSGCPALSSLRERGFPDACQVKFLVHQFIKCKTNFVRDLMLILPRCPGFSCSPCSQCVDSSCGQRKDSSVSQGAGRLRAKDDCVLLLLQPRWGCNCVSTAWCAATWRSRRKVVVLSSGQDRDSEVARKQ